MAENNTAELVFIPSPGIGHLMATVEMAKLLIHRDERLCITMLVIKPAHDDKISTTTYQDQSNSRIRFIDFPQVDPGSISSTSPISFITSYIQSHMDHVRNAVTERCRKSNDCRLAGFVVDMFCTCMIDVANEFSVPSYLFFTSGAAILGLVFHFQSLRDDQNEDLEAYIASKVEVTIPTYKYPVPIKLLPGTMFDNRARDIFLNHTKRFRETKGIMVNTFVELEPLAMTVLAKDETIPPVYSIGPVIQVNEADDQNPTYNEIMMWLDQQPDSSVVFLCFGSMGCFGEHQVKEIAFALERTGHRFLWSLRKPPVGHVSNAPVEYENFEEVLPQGFLERTSGIGKVIGWAPQVAVLKHPSVSGFVSHCGWNSTLESVWCGVPMGAWPLYAEQQMNAFELVKEVGAAVDIKMDYIKGSDMMVPCDEIEKGVRSLMEPHSDIRATMEGLKEKSRIATADGGSSFGSIKHFIDSVIDNTIL